MALVFCLLLPCSLYDQGYKHDRLVTDDLARIFNCMSLVVIFCSLSLNLGFLFTQFR